MQKNSEPLLTKKQLAILLNCSIRTVENYIHDGTIVPIEIGKMKRFPSNREEFLNKCVKSKRVNVK
jgi:hypothetical protein